MEEFCRRTFFAFFPHLSSSSSSSRDCCRKRRKSLKKHFSFFVFLKKKKKKKKKKTFVLHTTTPFALQVLAVVCPSLSSFLPSFLPSVTRPKKSWEKKSSSKNDDGFDEWTPRRARWSASTLFFLRRRLVVAVSGGRQQPTPTRTLVSCSGRCRGKDDDEKDDDEEGKRNQIGGGAMTVLASLKRAQGASSTTRVRPRSVVGSPRVLSSFSRPDCSAAAAKNESTTGARRRRRRRRRRRKKQPRVPSTRIERRPSSPLGKRRMDREAENCLFLGEEIGQSLGGKLMEQLELANGERSHRRGGGRRRKGEKSPRGRPENEKTTDEERLGNHSAGVVTESRRGRTTERGEVGYLID